MIPYSRQCIDKQDINEIVNVLKGKFVTSGWLTTSWQAAENSNLIL